MKWLTIVEIQILRGYQGVVAPADAVQLPSSLRQMPASFIGLGTSHASLLTVFRPGACSWARHTRGRDPSGLVFHWGRAREAKIAEGSVTEWPMSSSSAPNGATKGRARSSTGC